MLKYLFAAAFTGLTLFAQSVPPVNVKVSVDTSQQPKATVYHYRVINNGTAPITGVVIGYDYFHAQPELANLPLGADVDNGIPPTSETSPPGWTVRIVPTEGTAALDLEWSTTDPSNAISPGQTLSGFSVVVPASDATYVKSHWTVSFNGGGDVAMSSTLSQEALCDVPRISVSVAEHPVASE